LALLKFCSVDGAKTDKGLAAGFKRGETAAEIFFDSEVDVRGDLGFEVGVERGLDEEGAEAGEGSLEGAH
jgi:hypothetical protein